MIPAGMSHQPDNIFAGTQVVSRVEIRGTNNSFVHPRGAVGVVTRTPTADHDQFLIRFPDGVEVPLTREQLDVLKHFKDRLGRDGVSPSQASRTAPCGPSPFDLESLVIYPCAVGSRAYGLDNDDSDTDRRGQAVLGCHYLRAGPACFEDNASHCQRRHAFNLGGGVPFGNGVEGVGPIG